MIDGVSVSANSALTDVAIDIWVLFRSMVNRIMETNPEWWEDVMNMFSLVKT